MSKEKPATGAKGFLMTPICEGDANCYFRVYHKNKKGHPSFTDYLITATDIQVTITDDAYVSFKKDPKLGPILDWSDDTLGISKKKRKKK